MAETSLFTILNRGRPPKIETVEEFASKVEEYFMEGCKTTTYNSQGETIEKYIPTISFFL